MNVDMTPNRTESEDATSTPVIVTGTREHLIDMYVRADASNAEFRNKLFVRLVAKGRTFTKVDFSYTIFDACYLRDCKFDSCKFVGCRFVGTNLHGSKFRGCKFDYALFERTYIDAEILDTECPPFENLKMKFARSLRVNYQQIGDASGVNKAISVEIAATKEHLWKSWKSTESYYRDKYRGWNRVAGFWRWLGYKMLDWLWGHGESPVRLLLTLVVLLITIGIGEALTLGDARLVSSFGRSLWQAPQVFLGVVQPPGYDPMVLALITFARLVLLGFFISMLVRRLSRR